MILSVEELMSYPEFSGLDEDLLKQKLDAVESLVRKYTNNNFQNRNIRFIASCTTPNYLNNVSPYVHIGDTIQISETCGINDGLFTVSVVTDDRIKVEERLYACEHNLVTKVEYPSDIKLGVINLLKWDLNNRDKVGIKSETISRHSITYFDMDSSNQVMGYPVSLLGFLDLYKKARF